MEKHQCAATVPNKDDRWGNRHPCSRSGLRFEDDQWWCKTHAPSAVKARDEAWRAELFRKWEEEREAWRRGAAMGRACANFSTDALEGGVVAEMVAACTALSEHVRSTHEIIEPLAQREGDYGLYWSPAGVMVDTMYIMAIRKAIAKAEQKGGE